MSNEDTFRIDLRKRLCETREVREGNAMLMQFRNSIINLDGSIEYGEWITSGTITNYGDCFDKKPTFLERVFGA